MSLKYFEDQLPLGKHELKTAITMQPELFYRLSSEHVAAQNAAENAEHNLKILRAELQPKIRNNLAVGKGKPPTEDEVKAAIDINRDHQDAKSNAIDKQADALLYGALREAYRQRHESLMALARMAT